MSSKQRQQPSQSAAMQDDDEDLPALVPLRQVAPGVYGASLPASNPYHPSQWANLPVPLRAPSYMLNADQLVLLADDSATIERDLDEEKRLQVNAKRRAKYQATKESERAQQQGAQHVPASSANELVSQRADQYLEQQRQHLLRLQQQQQHQQQQRELGLQHQRQQQQLALYLQQQQQQRQIELELQRQWEQQQRQREQQLRQQQQQRQWELQHQPGPQQMALHLQSQLASHLQRQEVQDNQEYISRGGTYTRRRYDSPTTQGELNNAAMQLASILGQPSQKR